MYSKPGIILIYSGAEIIFVVLPGTELSISIWAPEAPISKNAVKVRMMFFIPIYFLWGCTHVPALFFVFLDPSDFYWLSKVAVGC